MVALTTALVLASASPRRRDLLETVGLGCKVEPVDADESRLPGESPERYVERIASLKLELWLARNAERPGVTAIAADTTVAIDDDVLGKPDDDAHALAMLERLSGRVHRVCTAVALGSPTAEANGLLATRLVTTWVRFRPVDAATLRAYVATGEGRDKAGAYAIQGIAGGFVESIEGSYSNVVGLPVAQTLALLQELGILRSWP